MENCEKIDPKSSSVLAGSDEVPDELVREEEGNLLSNLSIECEGGRWLCGIGDKKWDRLMESFPLFARIRAVAVGRVVVGIKSLGGVNG